MMLEEKISVVMTSSELQAILCERIVQGSQRRCQSSGVSLLT